eukprot:14316342-Alexandrium_andersonii.AAC.1
MPPSTLPLTRQAQKQRQQADFLRLFSVVARREALVVLALASSCIGLSRGSVVIAPALYPCLR